MISILSDNQRRLLTLLSEEIRIYQTFYLSGGTALAEFYLQHRLSEDLDFILKQEPWTIADLVKKARIKFDYHIDPLQLGTQFMRAQELKDYPRMLIPLDPSSWQVFFLEEAKRLSTEILM